MKRFNAVTDAYPHMTEERLAGIRRDAEVGKCASAQTIRLCDLIEALWQLLDKRTEEVLGYRAQELIARSDASIGEGTQINYVPIQSAIELLRNCPISEILGFAAKYSEPECAESILDAAADWLQKHRSSVSAKNLDQTAPIGWGRGMFIAGAAAGVTRSRKSRKRKYPKDAALGGNGVMT